jgi:hypothetical protein
MNQPRPLLVFACFASVTLAADERGDDLSLLLARSTSVIQDALKEETPNRRAAVRARVSAVMLAAAAQQDLAGKDAAQRAALRDTAIEVARRIANQEYDQARQLARTLPKLPPRAVFTKDKVKLLGPHLEMDELMSAFRKTSLGGLNIEAELDRLENDSENQTLAPAEMTEALQVAAQQTALAGELLQDYRPAENAPQWRKSSEVMQRTALELTRAVKAKDGKAAYQAVVQANANCTACHKLFR